MNKFEKANSALESIAGKMARPIDDGIPLTLEEAALLAGTTKRHLLSCIKNGSGPQHYLLAGNILIPVFSLSCWMQERRERSS